MRDLSPSVKATRARWRLLELEQALSLRGGRACNSNRAPIRAQHRGVQTVGLGQCARRAAAKRRSADGELTLAQGRSADAPDIALATGSVIGSRSARTRRASTGAWRQPFDESAVWPLCVVDETPARAPLLTPDDDVEMRLSRCRRRWYRSSSVSARFACHSGRSAEYPCRPNGKRETRADRTDEGRLVERSAVHGTIRSLAAVERAATLCQRQNHLLADRQRRRSHDDKG